MFKSPNIAKLAVTPPERHVQLIDNLHIETDDNELDAIVALGERRLLNWRHNMEFGARAIVLTNQKGAVLELSGEQVGLMANLDLSGLAITLK